MSRIVTTESMRAAFSGFLASSALDHSRSRGERTNHSQPALVIADAGTPLELVAALRDLRAQSARIAGVLVLLSTRESGIAQLIDVIDSEVERPVRTFDSAEVAELKRIAQAHLLGAQDELIARARIVGNELWVTGCNLELYRVSRDEIAALRRLSDEQFSNFATSTTGSWIHWESGDIDLSLRDFRYVADEEYKRFVDKQNRTSMQSYGKAIKTLRKHKGLRQRDIEEKVGLSEREVRRLEKGKVQPHSTTLEKLAAAHEMELSQYLSALADLDS